MEEAKNHIIVCGYGLAGEEIVDVLLEHNVKVVVVDSDPAKIAILKERGIATVLGDATSSRTLRAAGIEKATAIAVAMDSDAKNLFTVITARSLNDKIVIATRANDDFLRDKLKDAGAGFVATADKSASDEIFKELSKGL